MAQIVLTIRDSAHQQQAAGRELDVVSDSHNRAEGNIVSSTPTWVQWILILLLMAIVYRGVLGRLVQNWWNDPNYSHGFLVPLFAGFVLWRRKKSLSEVPLRPSPMGLLIIAASLLELMLGIWGVELFLSRTSFIFLLAGLVIYFYGWKMFSRVLFPWAVLFLMIPIPAIIFNQIALPLQFLASRLSTALLGFLGVPVLREGNVIRLASMSLEVVEACSGIRSLLSLVTLAIMYGYLFERKPWVRMTLACAAVPIAVAANGLRIMGTGLLGQYWDPDKAQGFFHEFSGVLIFALSMAMLYIVHIAVMRISPSKVTRSS